MKRLVLIWIGIALAGLAVGGFVSAVKFDNAIGGTITGVIFGAAAWRTWYIASEARSPQS
jgi:membrane associated rhomboid family serine protease